jgi:hypothetical protein
LALALIESGRVKPLHTDEFAVETLRAVRSRRSEIELHARLATDSPRWRFQSLFCQKARSPSSRSKSRQRPAQVSV